METSRAELQFMLWCLQAELRLWQRELKTQPDMTDRLRLSHQISACLEAYLVVLNRLHPPSLPVRHFAPARQLLLLSKAVNEPG